MSKDIRIMIDKIQNLKRSINENVNNEEKYFMVTDKTGRSAKPYQLDKTHIENTWDLTDTDWTTEQTLYEYLNDCYIGDIWSTNEVEFECVAIK